MQRQYVIFVELNLVLILGILNVDGERFALKHAEIKKVELLGMSKKIGMAQIILTGKVELINTGYHMCV